MSRCCLQPAVLERFAKFWTRSVLFYHSIPRILGIVSFSLIYFLKKYTQNRNNSLFLCVYKHSVNLFSAQLVFSSSVRLINVEEMWWRDRASNCECVAIPARLCLFVFLFPAFAFSRVLFLGPWRARLVVVVNLNFRGRDNRASFCAELDSTFPCSHLDNF